MSSDQSSGPVIGVIEPPVNVTLAVQKPIPGSVQDSLKAYEKDIQDELYYHGFMTRAEADTFLKKNGQFLVRRIEECDQFHFVVSVLWNNEKLHYKIKRTPRKNYFYLNKKKPKTTVPSLIRYHRYDQAPINETSKAILQHPVQRNHYAIYREQIIMGEKLGHGEFGEVFAGRLRLGFFRKVNVAVKTMKSDNKSLSMDERIQFLREANIMMQLKHKNVIRLYGVCAYEDPIWIVLEAAKGGSLLSRVKKEENPPTVRLLEKFSREVCEGMAYLEKYKIIHCDLAARNCLVNEEDVVKIADFGLSIKGILSKNVAHAKVPFKWYGPEVLINAILSASNDVWSYGVTLFEIWSRGDEPYTGIPSIQIIAGVREGTLRPQPSNDMPNSVAQIMEQALTFDYKKRPTFSELRSRFYENKKKKHFLFL
ncbi:protein tyrosine kinase domain-containing protein [Ditylenchus destructor]|uniref:Tyrosine-protein kinase n=1 Tax=Ditylenchus destructor TaxID=166010 RepID=A0AAD4N9V5_9BILA|nr:protein tyrosine kinase domain-containing protein [Ditylenchus destructor]